MSPPSGTADSLAYVSLYIFQMQAFTFSSALFQRKLSDMVAAQYFTIDAHLRAMNQHRQTPTLHDVAAQAGVSTATVSRCLNTPDLVSERARRKVHQAVTTLGYSPNFGARAMASRRTNTIGAIIPTMENAVFARGLQAFQEELDRRGYTLLVACSSYRQDAEEAHIRSLVARGADALLLIGHERAPEIYDFLAAQDVPALVTWAFDDKVTRPSVGFDNETAMRGMASIVLEMGHRQIALISARTEHNDRAFARKLGIEAAMRDVDLDPSNLLVIETDYSIENGAVAFDQIMGNKNPPTVVFCGNDVLAVGALNRARKLGIDVPNDVSIIGFDDIELAQVAYPALTTVHVPHREMGQKAAEALVNLVEHGTPLEPHNIPVRIMMRDTLKSAKSIAT